MTREDEKLPAEMREEPVVEPAVDVDEAAHIPPEAAVVATVHRDGPAAPEPEAVAAANRAASAAEAAHLPPAELRMPPVVEPDVEVADSARIPPEAGVVPHRPEPAG
jgi:hypothetical protein